MTDVSVPSRSRTLAEERVPVQVVERHVGRRTHDDEDPGAVDPERVEDAGVGHEAVEVVLLLQTGVAHDLARPGTQSGEPVLRDHVGDDHPRRRAAAEPVLCAGELVVERVRGRDPQRPRREGQLVRRVRERHVEALAARERPQCLQSSRHGAHLRGPRRAGMRRADDRVRQPGVLEELERLREVARRDRHLVAALLEQRDQRTEEDDVRGVRDVDPDAHHGASSRTERCERLR